jgi:hypothetical protein
MASSAINNVQYPVTPGPSGVLESNNNGQTGTDASFLHRPPTDRFHELMNDELHVRAMLAMDTLKERGVQVNLPA